MTTQPNHNNNLPQTVATASSGLAAAGDGAGLPLFAAYDKDAIGGAMDGNLEPLFETLGLPKHGSRHECPFCHSKSGFSGEGGGIRCHKCGWTGDGFTLIRELRNLSFPEALQFAAEVYSYGPLTPPKPKQKKTLPPIQLDRGTTAEQRQVAGLRNVNFEAVQLAVERGLLRFGVMDGHRCWITTDGTGRNLQARRIDGLPLTAGGREIKTKTVPGSEGAWPIGITEAQAYAAIALVEGSADVLAAHHFMICEGVEDHIAVVGMMGGQNSIPDEALPLFAGKRVRIFPDADKTGRDAAGRWFKQLTDAGATVDCLSLEGLPGVKDLNDLTSMDADTFEAERSLWSLFYGMAGEGGSI